MQPSSKTVCSILLAVTAILWSLPAVSQRNQRDMSWQDARRRHNEMVNQRRAEMARDVLNPSRSPGSSGLRNFSSYLRPKRHNNRMAVSYYNQGLSRYRQGKVELALSLFEKALSLDPTIIDAQYNLGVLYQNSNRIEEARNRFQQVLRLNPSDFDAQNQLAKLNSSGGSNAGNQIDYRPQVKRFPVENQPIDRSYTQPQQSTQTRQVESQPAVKVVSTNSASAQIVKSHIEEKPVGDKWALVIGISKFQKTEYNLEYSAKDARDFYNFLVSEANFKKDHVKLLIDQDATRANIMSAFGSSWLPRVTEPGDLVVVYVSTHGTPSDVDDGKRNYIVAYDTDANDLYPTGVDMDEILRRIKEGVKTDRALIVLDTCYSGSAVPGARGLVRNSNFDISQLKLGSGHLVISSSSPGERAWESKRYNNGVFTRQLIEALRLSNHSIGIKDAFKTLKQKVTWEVKCDRKKAQTPQFGGSWQGSELVISVPAQSPRSLGPNN